MRLTPKSEKDTLVLELSGTCGIYLFRYNRNMAPTKRPLEWICDMKKRVIDGVEVQRSSGNVFADLGLPDAGKLKIKTGLVIEIRKAIRQQGKRRPWGQTSIS